MNKEIKARWIERLRSGNYRQVGGPLHCNKGGFCALGVLADIYLEDHGEQWQRTGGANYFITQERQHPRMGRVVDECYSTLPFRVAEWAEISPGAQDDIAVMNDELGEPRSEAGYLQHVNDFNKIADWIEKYL